MGLHCIVRCDDLLKAVSAQQNITGKKGSMAILSNLLLETDDNHLICTGTDLEIGLKQIIAAEVIEAGKITLPAKKLFELARESGGNDIVLKEQDNAWVEIEAGPGHYRLAGMQADEFPQFPLYDEKAQIAIKSEIFTEIIDKTYFSIAQDKESIFSLTAALLQKYKEEENIYIKMVASDGHRLSLCSKKIETNIDILELNSSTLIPRRGIQEIRKFCENSDTINLGVEEKQIVLKNENSILIVRLMKGDFPDFASLLQSISQENIVHINRIRFLEALKRINLFTEDISHAIKICLKQNKIVLNSQHTEYGSATDAFEIQYGGEDIDLAFNCRYFIEVIQVMEGDIIKVTVKDEKSPCMITSDQDEGFLCVIMPMKL